MGEGGTSYHSWNSKFWENPFGNYRLPAEVVFFSIWNRTVEMPLLFAKFSRFQSPISQKKITGNGPRLLYHLFQYVMRQYLVLLSHVTWVVYLISLSVWSFMWHLFVNRFSSIFTILVWFVRTSLWKLHSASFTPLLHQIRRYLTSTLHITPILADLHWLPIRSAYSI